MQFAHIANYPHFKFVPIPNLPTFQIRHVTIHPHSQSPPCYNLPPFQIHPCYNSLYAVACVFPQIANITNSPILQITHVTNHPCFQLPPCGRANCNQPLHGCYQDVHKYTCKYTKKHHGHGMGSFAHVVGANCNQPLHVCFLNVHKYTCKYTKKHHGHGVSTFVCVVGANCNSPMLQFAHIANYPCYNSPPCGRANCNQPLHGCYQDVRKHTCKYTKKASRAWYGFFCARCRGKVRELAQRSM